MSVVIPAGLCPWLTECFTDAVTGLPVANGSVQFTLAGSSFATKKNTYADNAYVTANPNPVPLNASGQPVNMSGALVAIFLLPGGYDVQVFDVNNVQLYTRLGVVDVGLTFATQFNSSLMAGARNVNASIGYAVAPTDNFITILNGGTVTLQPGAARTFPIGIKNLDAANAVSIAPNGAETIDTVAAPLSLPVAASPKFPTIWLGPDVVAGSGYLVIASHHFG